MSRVRRTQSCRTAARPVRAEARAAQRHVLVVRLVRGGAAREEIRIEVFGPVVGVIVVDFVVVPGHEPRRRSVAALQVGIAFVERVTVAVLVERVGLAGIVLAHVIAAPRRFVDVIAEEHDEIEVFGRHVPVRRVVALLVLLARREREAQAFDRGIRGGCSARAADGLTASPAMKRYQYQCAGSRSVNSTCTLCPSSGVAVAVAVARRSRRNFRRAASSHFAARRSWAACRRRRAARARAASTARRRPHAANPRRRRA